MRDNRPVTRLLIVISFVVCSMSCKRPLKGDSTVCPESRGLQCLTGIHCSTDSARGCRVCRCIDLDTDTDDNRGRRDRPAFPED